MKKIKMYLVLTLMASSMSVLAADNQSTPLVSGGIKVQTNASNLLLNDVPTKPSLHTTMNAGGELGGFVDFNIKEHFLIQLNLLGVATLNDLREDTQHSKLWSIGLEIPLYFLGRYGSDTRGYISFGGGPSICQFQHLGTSVRRYAYCQSISENLYECRWRTIGGVT